MTQLNKQEHRLRMLVSVILGIVIGFSGQSYAHPFTRSGPTGGGGGGGAVFTGGDVPDPTTFADAVIMLTTFAVTGISIFTGQIQANGGIKLLANRDITCASGSSCEIGSATFAFLRIFSNQIDAIAIRAKDFGFFLDINEPHGLLIAHVDDAAPAQPHACTVAADFGMIHIVNENDDAATSTVCYCGQLADDSTYDWLKVKDDTACGFF